MKNFVAFLCGLIFSLGLIISGMTQPHVVRGFLDVFGNWDPRLIGVMGGAIGIHAILFRFIMKRPSPVLDSAFYLPSKRDIDRRLIVGAMIFGLGWGWAGICPGPGVVGLASGDFRFMIFILAMLLGMLVFQLSDRHVFKR